MTLGDILETLEEKGIKLPENAAELIYKLLGDNSIEYIDPIDYLNSKFPDLESLNNIESEFVILENELFKTEADIEKQLREICLTSSSKTDECQQNSIILNSLVDKIESLSEMAKDSHSIATDVTKDIKQLEIAKKNLSISITMLKHFKTLTTELETLKTQLNEDDFEGMSKSMPPLEAIQEILQQYRDVEQVESILKTYLELKEIIKQRIRNEFSHSCHLVFDELYNVSPKLMSSLTYIGDCNFSLRDEMLEVFLTHIFREYIENFNENIKNQWIDQIDSRFSWFKRQLVSYDQLYNMWFPYSWEVDRLFIVKFYDLTKNNLTELLQKRVNEMDCKLLLSSIQKCVLIEDYLTNRCCSFVTNQEFQGLFTAIFKDYIYFFVEAQEKNLKTIISEVLLVFNTRGYQGLIDNIATGTTDEEKLIKMTDNTVTAPTIINLVVSIATDIFLYYKRCLMQFSKMRIQHSIGLIVCMFKKYLDEIYSKILENAFSKLSKITSHNIFDVTRVCSSILVTTGYCAETTDQLESKIKELYGDLYTSELSFADVRVKFVNLCDASTDLLVKATLYVCEPCFSAMSAVNWAEYKSVGDQSAYVSDLAATLQQHIPLVRKYMYMSDQYIPFMLVFIQNFVQIYYECVFNCKPITSSGVEQLLLDTQTLKKFLFSLPKIGSDPVDLPPEYNDIVRMDMKKIELLLKLVITPHTPYEDFVHKFIALFKFAHQDDFKLIIAMKCLNKREQNLLTKTLSMLNMLKTDQL